MLFGVVQPSTDYELELNINSKGRLEPDGIIPSKYYEKVKFKGFIEGRTINECRNKLIKMNEKFHTKYRLYGFPFSRKGNIINV